MSFSVTRVRNKWGELSSFSVIINKLKFYSIILPPLPLIFAIWTLGSIPESPQYSGRCIEQKWGTLQKGTLKVLTKILLYLLCDSSHHNIFLYFRAVDWEAIIILLLCQRGKNQSMESEIPDAIFILLWTHHLTSVSLSFYICKIDIYHYSLHRSVLKDNVVLTHCLTDEVFNK